MAWSTSCGSGVSSRGSCVSGVIVLVLVVVLVVLVVVVEVAEEVA